MKPNDDLDKILLSEKEINPSPSFIRDVMLRVQVEASLNRKTSFPWFPFIAAMLLVAIPIIYIFPAESFLHAMNLMSYNIGKWILTPGDPALRHAFLSLLASLLGILILFWFSHRLVGVDR